MAVPQLITFTATCTKTDGTPDTGTITFQTPGFLRSAVNDQVISPGTYSGALDTNGHCSFTVPSCDDGAWTPQGWAYTVIVALSKSRQVFSAIIPAASPSFAIDLADIVPALQTGGAQYAPIAHTHAGGGGGSLNPSGAVVSGTSFGQSATAGASVDYSRGDHAHGTPAAQTLGSLGAAATAHTHTGTYVPVAGYTPTLVLALAAPVPGGTAPGTVIVRLTS